MSIQTIVLKHCIQDFELLDRLQKAQNTVINLAYNRAMDDMGEKEIRAYLKTRNLPKLDSWFTQCGVKKGIGLANANKKKDELNETDTRAIFGGKKLWNEYIQKKITKEEWKREKLFPLIIQGESPKNGNRKFTLDIENNVMFFRASRGEHLTIRFEKPSFNQKRLLLKVQELAHNRLKPYQIQIDRHKIYISFEQEQVPSTKKDTRIAGIDQNPNYLSLVICDNHGKLIHQELFDFSELNQLVEDKKIHTNKLKHEKIAACISIHKTLVHYKVTRLCLEDLKFKKPKVKNETFKSTKVRKLVSNLWHRKLITAQLQKRCDISGIYIKLVNPSYSSFAGNLLYGLPDAISSALEVARRGSVRSSSTYPKLISGDILSNRWKEATKWNYSSWYELYQIFKSKNLIKEYRIPMTSKDLVYQRFISPTTMVGKYECDEHSYFSM